MKCGEGWSGADRGNGKWAVEMNMKYEMWGGDWREVSKGAATTFEKGGGLKIISCTFVCVTQMTKRGSWREITYTNVSDGVKNFFSSLSEFVS